MEATKKKSVTNEDEEPTNLLDKRKKKPQSDFMKQLTDLAQQVVEPPPPQPTEPLPDEIKRQVKSNRIFYLFFILFFFTQEPGEPSSSSQAGSRLARPTPLRHPPPPKPVAPPKPARIPVKVIPTVVTESTQTIETVRAKTPRQFSASFLRFVDKLKELNWFEEQYPMVKIDVSSQ